MFVNSPNAQHGFAACKQNWNLYLNLLYNRYIFLYFQQTIGKSCCMQAEVQPRLKNKHQQHTETLTRQSKARNNFSASVCVSAVSRLCRCSCTAGRGGRCLCPL